MKTAKTNETVEGLVKGLLKDNPKGGSINLDEICSKVKHMDRWTLVSHLKRNREGVFVTGRRGKKSRFVYGEPAELERNKMAYQANRRNVPTRRSRSAPIEGQIVELPATVEINGKTITFPVNVRIEAEAVAA